jgi:hypothetical protein
MGGAQSVTFDPQTGSLSLKFPDPKLDTVVKPDDTTDLTKYMDTLSQNATTGQIKQPGVYPVSFGSTVFTIIPKQQYKLLHDKLPAVSMYKVDSPPARAVIYTNAQGVSNFCYVNDPSKLIQLISGGSMISGDSMMISGGTETGTKGGASYQETGTKGTETGTKGGVYQLVCVVLVCLCLILIMIGIFFAMKKSVTTANK